MRIRCELSSNSALSGLAIALRNFHFLNYLRQPIWLNSSFRMEGNGKSITRPKESLLVNLLSRMEAINCQSGVAIKSIRNSDSWMVPKRIEKHPDYRPYFFEMKFNPNQFYLA
jgi:hypothetical protein